MVLCQCFKQPQQSRVLWTAFLRNPASMDRLCVDKSAKIVSRFLQSVSVFLKNILTRKELLAKLIIELSIMQLSV